MKDILNVLQFLIDSVFLVVDNAVTTFRTISNVIPNALGNMLYISSYLGAFGAFVGIFCFILITVGFLNFILKFK